MTARAFLKTVPDEVRDHLHANGHRYLDLLGALRGELEALRRLDRGTAVRAIYSRGEKQSGHEFKSLEKIAAKLARARGKIPGMPVADISDIIGLTVVCYFPSHVDTIASAIREHDRLRVFHEELKSDYGYYAYHIDLNHRSPDYFGLLCEVQIKTMLHDAWAAKTHPLTYKPLGQLDARVRQLMQVLGDTLQSIEQQSELLKSLAEEAWHIDRDRKYAGKRVLVRQIESKYRSEATVVLEADIARECNALFDHLYSHEDNLLICGVNEPVVTETLERIENFSRHDGALGYTCIMTMFLAVLRPLGDLNHVGLSYLDRWIAGMETAADRVQGLHVKSLALFCFGDLQGATDCARRALEVCEGGAGGVFEHRVKLNLAYYLAEQNLEGSEQRAASRRELERLIAEAEEATHPVPCSLLDTKGVVKIAVGESEREIEEGLELCRTARDAAEGEEKKVLEVFYDLHKRHAWRRLLDITESPPSPLVV